LVSARAYYGTRDNVQYQAGIPPATPTGAWVGLNRAYYGAGLQYNAQSRLGATPLTWVAGYEFDLSRETRKGGAAAVGIKTSTTRNEDNQAENSDFFAQATARLSDLVSVVAGLRYSTVRFSSDDDFLGDGNGSGTTCFSATSPVLGLTYHASDSLNLYANYGKGFESPTLAEVAYSGAGVPAFNTSVNASSSQHYEVGAKWAPSPRSRLDFAVFQIESKDEIVVASSTGGNSTFKNAPGTLRAGWELAGSTLLTPHVRAMVAASMVDATFSKTFASGTTTVVSGNKIPGIPHSFLFSEVLWSGQPLDKNNKTSALGSQAGVEFTKAGRLLANDTNTASVDGYATFNLKASHGWAVGSGSLTTYARVDNLTDQRYVGSVIVNQASSQFYEPAPGKNWTLGLRLVLPL
jgi:iron complex outermembrane receptor protein